MRLLRFGPEESRSIDHHESSSFRVTPLAKIAGEAQIAVAHLGPGGRIGRHPATVRQILAVVTGSGWASGADGIEHELGPGIAALWEAGEEHETRTDHGVGAVLIEGALDPVTAE